MLGIKDDKIREVKDKEVLYGIKAGVNNVVKKTDFHITEAGVVLFGVGTSYDEARGSVRIKEEVEVLWGPTRREGTNGLQDIKENYCFVKKTKVGGIFRVVILIRKDMLSQIEKDLILVSMSTSAKGMKAFLIFQTIIRRPRNGTKIEGGIPHVLGRPTSLHRVI